MYHSVTLDLFPKESVGRFMGNCMIIQVEENVFDNGIMQSKNF